MTMAVGRPSGPEGPPVVHLNREPTQLSTSEALFLDIYSYLQAEKGDSELDELTRRLQLEMIAAPDTGSDYLRRFSITGMNFQQLVDTSLPTIAIRADVSIPEALLYAQACQQLRHEGEELFNMVILPFSVYGKESETDDAHYAERGILVDRNGRIYFGDFPEPLQIDVMNGYGLAPDQEYVFDFINTPEIEVTLDDKEQTKELLDGIEHAQTLAIWKPGDDVETLVELFKEHKRVVLKPTNGWGGLEVVLFDIAEVDEAAFREQLTHYNEQEAVVMETWEEGIPILHPESEALLSGDIRAVAASDTTLVGMYARVGTVGTPANLASRPWTIEQAYSQAGLTNEQILALRRRVGAQTLAFAASAKTNILGSSVIINPAKEPVVIEGDGERSAGVGHITKLEKPTDPLALYKTVIKAWHENMADKLRPAGKRPSSNQTRRSVFFPEDAAQELFYHAQNLSDLRDVDFFREVVAQVTSAISEGEQIHPALQRLISRAADVVGPGEYMIPAHPSVAETIRFGRAALHDGALEEAAHYLNSAAERAWDIPSTQRNIASALIAESDMASQLAALVSDYTSDAVAKAYARTLYTHALTHSELDHLGISRSTAELVQETLAIYLLAPSDKRANLERILDTQSLSLFPKEAEFIKPLLDRLGQLDQAANLT